MKSTLLALLALAALAISPCYAQLVTDTTRFSESMWSMEKKKMVMEHLHLTEGQKASFWPIYESYNQAIRYIEMETLEILDTYQRAGDTMKPDELEKHSKRILLNDLLLAKVRKQYYKKFSKALTPDIASSFMHFDDMMRMVLRFEIKSGGQEAGIVRASLK